MGNGEMGNGEMENGKMGNGEVDRHRKPGAQSLTLTNRLFRTHQL